MKILNFLYYLSLISASWNPELVLIIWGLSRLLVSITAVPWVCWNPAGSARAAISSIQGCESQVL